tara:strand:- start:217 stop:549 length:333 start_codon:yes stop_codon:yes gene_type:complete
MFHVKKNHLLDITMLHTINQSPFQSNTFETALRFIQPGDPVLFLQDGAYTVQSSNRFADLVTELMQTNPVHVLQPELQARGIGNPLDGVKLIGYSEFVDLAVEHQVNSWL